MARRAKTGTGVRGPGTTTAPAGEAGGSARTVVAFSWQRHPGGRPTDRLRSLAIAVLAELGHAGSEVGVLVCDDGVVRSLNRRFRKIDRATDVLSFPAGFDQPGGRRYLGDIAISLDTARRQAEAAGIPVQRELETLLIHALLHLAGFDHERDDGEMAAREAALGREHL